MTIEQLLLQTINFSVVIIIVAMYLTHLYTKHIFKGVRLWILSLIFTIISFNFLISYNSNEDLILLSGILMLIGLCFFKNGIIMFLNRKIIFFETGLPTIISSLLLLIFYYIWDFSVIREIIIIFVIIYIVSTIIYMIIKNKKKTTAKYLYTHIIISMIIGLIQLVRLIFIIFNIDNNIIILGIRYNELGALIIVMFIIGLTVISTISINFIAQYDLKKERRVLKELSQTDYLTSLPNRRMLYEFLIELIDEKEKFALVMFDVDEFKKVNDLHGHTIGDKVLQEYSKRLEYATREGDFLSRFGGDEFVVVMRNCDNKQIVREKILRGAKKVTFPLNVSGLEFNIISSAGIAFYPSDGTSIEEIISKADESLYSIKNRDKGSMAFYSDLIR